MLKSSIDFQNFRDKALTDFGYPV